MPTAEIDLIERCRPAAPRPAEAMRVLIDWWLERGDPAGVTFTRALGDRTLTFVGIERCQCPNDVEGMKVRDVGVFRFEPFARAIGLAAGRRAIDTELVLLPPDGRVAIACLGDDPDIEDPPTIAIVPYWMARTAMTQRIYHALGGTYDGQPHPRNQFPGATNPVECTTWHDCTEFCARHGLRLPSEAEWEHSCRGGTETEFCFGSTITTTQVNYDPRYPYVAGQQPTGEYRWRTVPVGTLPANAYGLHEVHGNVWEWCADRANFDPARRALRGGGWGSDSYNCGSGRRHSNDPDRLDLDIGFRPARSLAP